MRYLLDTNILSHLVRQPRGVVSDQIVRAGQDQVCTSIIVAAELRFGGAKAGSARLIAQINAILGAIEILAFEPPDDAVYASIRSRLESAGRPIGGNDMLIAAQALRHGLVLVTDNQGEFSRIEDLHLDNWLLAR